MRASGGAQPTSLECRARISTSSGVCLTVTDMILCLGVASSRSRIVMLRRDPELGLALVVLLVLCLDGLCVLTCGGVVVMARVPGQLLSLRYGPSAGLSQSKDKLVLSAATCWTCMSSRLRSVCSKVPRKHRM